MLYFLLGAAVVAALAALADLRTGHIPNRLTLLALGGAIAGHFLRGTNAGGLRAGIAEAAVSVGGAAVCAIVPAFMHWRGGMGGGDVKLFAAIGAALHPLAGLEAETYAFVLAAVIAPAKLAWEGTLTRTLWNTFALIANVGRKRDKKREIPPAMRAWFRLGPAIFLGTVATLVVHSFELGAGR